MTKEEALELLKTAPCDDKPSKLNPVFTRAKFVEIILAAINNQPDGKEIHPIFEKRVWQAVKDQIRPRY